MVWLQDTIKSKSDCSQLSSGAIQQPPVLFPSKESIGFVCICFQPLDGKHNTKSDGQEPKTPYYIIPSIGRFDLY